MFKNFTTQKWARSQPEKHHDALCVAYVSSTLREQTSHARGCWKIDGSRQCDWLVKARLHQHTYAHLIYCEQSGHWRLKYILIHVS